MSPVPQGMTVPLNTEKEELPQVAYFSMEIALDPAMPTYCGGLGMLAGDTIRAAADRRVSMVAVSLVHRKGYSRQKLDAQGWQTDSAEDWSPETSLQELPVRIAVELEARTVWIRAWRYDIVGGSGGMVPVLLLDSDIPGNAEWDRTLTHHLYGGDARYRICQEVILGIGGIKMLRALGHSSIQRFHMNEGHAAMLVLALLDEQAAKAGRATFNRADLGQVRSQCVFTTHTPVPAGQDQFPMELVQQVLGRPEVAEMADVFCFENSLNMTYLALNASHYINGVAKRHAEISRHLFADYKIDAITNGIHVPTWASPSFQVLFDRHVPGWRDDAFSLRYALAIPSEEVWAAHMDAKRALLAHVERETSLRMDPEVLTLGFARRVATYKRADLLFHDPDRLRSIVQHAGRFQVVYAGKAHPQDQGGKELIHRVFEAMEGLKDDIRIVYLENYDWELGRLITAGSDVWLNTPQPPMEASGTSGMKAAVNGVPSLSLLDGWWIEGCIEGTTGWAIGEQCNRENLNPEARSGDASSLYDKLEGGIIPMFYHDRGRFIDIMRHAIALNGSFFNTQRMILQYVLRAYFE